MVVVVISAMVDDRIAVRFLIYKRKKIRPSDLFIILGQKESVPSIKSPHS